MSRRSHDRFLLRPFLLFALLHAATVAHAAIPISNAPGPSDDQQAINYADQAGGYGALSLVWTQYGPNFNGPATLRTFLFSVATASDLPTAGVTISTRASEYTQLARTGSIGCPTGSFCPSAVVVYTEAVDDTHNDLRVLRFGDLSGWDVSVTAATGNAANSRITSDGGAGAIVAWTDAGPRVQRLDGTGARQWGPQGVPVAAGVRTGPVLLAGDGSGGAFFAWLDSRVLGQPAIYAMHLDGNGAPVAGWPADGLLIRSGGPSLPQNPDILSDDSGGAYVVWSEYESTSAGLALQPRIVRINPDGSRFPGWLADGNRIAPFPDGGIYEPVVEPDGAGGILLAGTYTNSDQQSRVVVTRLNGDGSRPAGWPATGLDGTTVPGQKYLAAVVGQSGGAALVWTDGRRNGSTPDVYGARFLADGSRAAGWPAAGVPISVPAAPYEYLSVGTGATGEVLVAWVDNRSATETGADIWGAVLTADGRVTTLAVPSHPIGGPALAITSPNPSHGVVRGEFALASSGRVQLEVHDVAGRCVARLLDGDASAGPNAFEWDARDASGAAVRAGVYFLSLRSGEGSRSRAVVIAR